LSGADDRPFSAGSEEIVPEGSVDDADPKKSFLKIPFAMRATAKTRPDDSFSSLWIVFVLACCLPSRVGREGRSSTG
jgi:hypothetical protein